MDSLANGFPDGSLLLGSLGIILINVLLSADNSVVIAMAAQSLPADKRAKGILLGTLGAVSLRVLFTWLAAHLLEVPLLKLIGGLIILWIAVKLLLEQAEAEARSRKAVSLWHAVWIILVADLSVSLDNILAVAGASGGDAALLWISLGISIPLVVFASTLLSRLMDRYPAVLYLGAALLGRVGGLMIVTDPALAQWYQVDSPALKFAAQGVCAAGVVLVALWLRRRLRAVEPDGP